MDIWETLYRRAAELYAPREISPFLYAHHVVCALEAENGQIFTGFCIESCCGVMNLCAERVAALNMYLSSGQTVVRRRNALRSLPGLLFAAVVPKRGYGNHGGLCKPPDGNLAGGNARLVGLGKISDDGGKMSLLTFLRWLTSSFPEQVQMPSVKSVH